MIFKLKVFLKQHTLPLVYLVVFAGLLYGVFRTSGTTYFGNLFLYFFSLLIFYCLFSLPAVHKKVFDQNLFSRISGMKISFYYLLIPTLLVVFGHFLYLRGLPAFQALSLTYIEEVAMFRHAISADLPAWIAYPSSIALSSALPFLLLYFFITKKTGWYWVVLIVGALYTFSLMQKSHIVGFVFPTLVFAFATKKILQALKLIGLIGLVVFGLTFISNPPGGSNPEMVTVVTPDKVPADSVNTAAEYPAFGNVVLGIADRILVVPGRVVTGWFKAIPAEKPFLRGSGYRVYALATGKTFHNYSVELYPIIQPEYAAMGLTGSVNVASFMYEYANFGNLGLIISGFILAVLFAWLEFFFRGNTAIKISLCLFPVLLLSSGAITTLLFSGGFGFTIVFYYLYLRKKINA